jgi:signal transduction histidine kinase
MREAERSGTVQNREIPFRTKNGILRTGLISGEKVVIDNEDCILFIMKDITDLKETERQLILMDKYHLLGSIAASIAHEVRNPMTTVKGYLQLFMKGGELQKYRSRFELMLNEMERANSIISEYLSLANNRPIDKELHSLNEIIAYMRPLLEADALKNQVELSIRAGQIDTLRVNEKEIRQLLLNLCRNAIEAMSEGGTLTIGTYMEGPYVILEVADQGHGIESRLLDDIFTPFFTTKEKGTGLGLAVSRSIAERHNGTIRIKSGSGGTSFYVAFDTRPGQVTRLFHSN